MASADSDIRFDSVLARRSAEKRTALFVFPVVLIIVAIVVFAAVAISRMSGLQTELRIAQQQVQEANKVVEERDRQLRDAHAETAALASAGQGAAVLTATSKEAGSSGLALDHPAEHTLAVYAYNLAPAPEGQQYRLVVTDGTGRESMLGALRPDDRGAAFLLQRDVPEGLAKLEVALIPDAAAGGAAGAQNGQSGKAADANAKEGAKPAEAKAAPTERKPILAGELPKPGEAGVVMAAAQQPDQGAPRAQGRAARRGR